MACKSSSVRTVPVGLCGELMIIMAVLAVTASASALRSSDQERAVPEAAGMSGTAVYVQLASAMAALYES